jgi:hypothetical protein
MWAVRRDQSPTSDRRAGRNTEATKYKPQPAAGTDESLARVARMASIRGGFIARAMSYGDAGMRICADPSGMTPALFLMLALQI